MRVVKFEFSIATNMVGSTVRDNIELTFPDDVTYEEIEKEAEDCWKDWIWNHLDGCWKITSETKL